MNEIIKPSADIVPCPTFPISIRPGTVADILFMDELQHKHSKQVGFFPTKALEGKIRLGHVIVAWAGNERAGYCIGNDQYFKHDDIGVIYQMNVSPEYQRSFVGAALLKAQFERSAYGCKLYCAWCAQDIAANKFWENMGFVPLAIRAGSEKKARVHIFWQKRIRAGDTTTPYWFPSKTDGGALREGRIVLPIPPGTHWSDAKAFVAENNPATVAGEIQDATNNRPVVRKPKPTKPLIVHAAVNRGGFRFETSETATKTLKNREKKPKIPIDPKLIEASRELRDRWLEQVNNGNAPIAIGKYDVARELPESSFTNQRPALPAVAA